MVPDAYVNHIPVFDQAVCGPRTVFACSIRATSSPRTAARAFCTSSRDGQIDSPPSRIDAPGTQPRWWTKLIFKFTQPYRAGRKVEPGLFIEGQALLPSPHLHCAVRHTFNPYLSPWQER